MQCPPAAAAIRDWCRTLGLSVRVLITIFLYLPLGFCLLTLLLQWPVATAATGVGVEVLKFQF